MKATSTFSISKWDESGQKPISRVSAIYDVNGELKGSLTVEYIMHYGSDDPNAVVTYLGYLIFTGSILDKSGSFVLEDKGTYSSVGPVSDIYVKPDTGTNDLAGISGSGRYFAQGNEMILELEYSF